jgi:hypothetical protein
VGPARYG